MDRQWANNAFEICRTAIGDEKFNKRMAKGAQCPNASLGSKARLSMELSKLKKAVCTSSPPIQHNNAVGAIGYAVVLESVHMPETDFFSPGRRFRLRLRHSSIGPDNDDAAMSQREASLKFVDQNEDGPLDLIMFTGRAALAPNCKKFVDITRKRKPEEIKEACLKDPYYFFALVDALRKAPASYGEMVFYSQIAYKLVAKDGKNRLIKFRLIPADEAQESGLLETYDQEEPWENKREKKERRTCDYLSKEFEKRLESEPMRYYLQAQIHSVVEDNDEHWNPQKVWGNMTHPWFNIMSIIMTTQMASNSLNRTYFNIVNRPCCLKLPLPQSMWDYKSYHYAIESMLTTMEIKHVDQKIGRPLMDNFEQSKVVHHIMLCTTNLTDTRSKVDVYINLTGTAGRSISKRLDRQIHGGVSDKKEQKEWYEIETRPLGDLMTVTVCVRHRHLTDDWFLRYVVVADPDRVHQRHFPCHSLVLSKVTLRSGEVALRQNELHEVLRQERMLELRDKQLEYIWDKPDRLPGQLKGQAVRDMPVNEQLLADKYATVLWDIDCGATTAKTAATKWNRSSSPIRVSFKEDMKQSPDEPEEEEAPKKKGSIRRLSMPEKVVNNHNRLAQFQSKTPRPSVVNKIDSSGALSKWKKIKHTITFIAKASPKIPEGVQGEMCLACKDDDDFGRYYLDGPNPTLIKRCTAIPDYFAVTEDTVDIFLDRGLTLAEEIQTGHMYIADYSILHNIPCKGNGDHKYVTAPICLLYVRNNGDLIPIAIQIQHEAGPENPVWTPDDAANDWLMAKLWVRCADYQYHFFITHLLKCHLVIEPFALGMIRQLSSSHPVYKLLKPHLRYVLAGNTLCRSKLLWKGGPVEKWTALGVAGGKSLMKKYYANFNLEELDLPRDMMRRGVENSKTLPHYHYREDGIMLWNAVGKYVYGIIKLFYVSNDAVEEDDEIQAWVDDVRKHGFPVDDTVNQDFGIPTKFSTISELADLVTKLLFTATFQHAATHSDAMDLYGFMPHIPATMRYPPPKAKNTTIGEAFLRTLPEQPVDGYYTSLAKAMSECPPDGESISNGTEKHFVEDCALEILEEFRHDLQGISVMISTRNAEAHLMYEALVPDAVPNCMEPVPFWPENKGDKSIYYNADYRSKSHCPLTPAVPLLTLPMCMHFASSSGGHGFLARRMRVNMFSKAMQNVDGMHAQNGVGGANGASGGNGMLQKKNTLVTPHEQAKAITKMTMMSYLY